MCYRSFLDCVRSTKGRVIRKNDSKSESFSEGTMMVFVYENGRWSEISDKDLQNALDVHDKRTGTPNEELKTFAYEFHEKINKIRSAAVDFTCFIDPDTAKTGSCIQPDEKCSGKELLNNPEVWNMNRETGTKLRQLLHHFTRFIPAKGRPFIRYWLDALIACFSYWIRNSKKEKWMMNTLKYFLSAFGQAGIVVCLPDKGASSLQSLKYSAHAVEAEGRAIVERYYWDSLWKDSFDKKSDWCKVANIKNKPLELSQLDTLPKGWLKDAPDWVNVFANVVSPEINGRFTTVVENTIKKGEMNNTATVLPGPPKTLARSTAKAHEYMAESKTNKKRWNKFRKNFKSTFDREPSKPADFVWNIANYARCSIVVTNAIDIIKVKKLFEEEFEVVCVKNGYSSDHKVKGSGYRDLKLLVKVDFDNLELKCIPEMKRTTTMICELQILYVEWLDNKETTSISYKVLRAETLKKLLTDFAKYLPVDNDLENEINPTKVLKNGWTNMAKVTDFTHIDASKHLLDACQNNWNVRSVDYLVDKLKADLETKGVDGRTPASWCARRGYSTLLESLINKKADIKNTDTQGFTSLHHAAKGGNLESVMLLLAANASCSAKDSRKRTPLDIAVQWNFEGIEKILKGEKVQLPYRSEKKQVSKMDMLRRPAIENFLSDYLDTHDLERSAVSHLFSSQAVATSEENIVQLLWFGAEVNHVDEDGLSALCYAAKHGTLKTLNLILEAKADVNFQTTKSRWSPLIFATNFDKPELVTALLDANADTELRANQGHTALHYAVGNQRGGMTSLLTSLLLKAGADTSAMLDNGQNVMSIAQKNKEKDEVMRLIKAARKRVKRI